MAGSSGSSILPIVLLGGAGYVAYKIFFSSTTPATPATPATGPTTAATPATPPNPYNTPDQIYQRLVANLTQNAPAFKANPASAQLTPYQFQYYLSQVTQIPSGLNFAQMFPGQVNADGSPTATPNLTLGQFWTQMAPWLTQNVPGMSGIRGRGMAGLILARGRR